MSNWHIQYDAVAVGADKATTITASNPTEFSNLKRVPFGAQDDEYITLELNNWVLDGTYIPLPINAESLGFWSKTLSNESGSFGTHPVLTATLSDKFSSEGIQLEFSNALNDFASGINIQWFGDDTELANQNFEPNSATFFCAQSVVLYNKVVVEFFGTAKPFRRIKLAQLAYGRFVSFDQSDCISIKILQELSPLSTTLPESKLNFEINTGQNVSFMFQEKQPVRVFLENEILGSFFIKSAKQTSKYRYSIEAEDAIGVLSDIPYTQKMYETDTKAKDIVSNILGSEFFLEWSNDIEAETVKGLISAKNAREAIQQICFAIGAVCHTDFSSGIVIEKLKKDIAIDIPNNRIYAGNSVEKSAVLTSLNVYSHQYTETQDANAPDVIKVGEKYYKHSTEVNPIANKNVADSAKRNVFEIKDATLVNADNVQSLSNRVFNFLLKTNTHNLKFKRTSANERLGAFVSAQTPFDETAQGFLEHAEIELSGIVAINGKYVF